MDLKLEREKLLKSLESIVLKSENVISAFRQVKREDFVPKEYREYSYVDKPLPIGHGQTISQPYTVAFMTEFLDVKKGHKILEIGSGSGYQAAVLSEIVGKSGKVFTVERIKELYEFAKNNLKSYSNVSIVESDGSIGYEKESPYDRIIVTASAPKVPQSLIDQLKPNGKMIIPIKTEMLLIEKNSIGLLKRKSLGAFMFVPLKGKFGFKST